MSGNLSFLRRFVLSDLRQSWLRFAFVVLSFAVGVGILVAIAGLSANIAASIDSEAKSLLAADITIASSQPLPTEVVELIPSSVRQSSEVTFASMVVVPSLNDASRLVQVRAITGGYPYYGDMVVEPPGAFEALREQNATGVAVLDRTLAQQFELGVGSEVKLGAQSFTVIGLMQQFPGESYARTVIAPKVFVPYASAVSSELLQRGSRVTYKRHLADSLDSQIASTVAQLSKVQPQYRFELETVASRRKNIARVLDTVSRFLALVSFAALLLGGVGVGGAMYTYIQSRLPVVASLRCLGATSSDVLRLYLLQGVVVSLLGTLLGAALGLGIQYLLPALLGEFLPLQISAHASLPALIQGIGVGLLFSLFFCAWPLLRVVAVSPLQAIRGAEQDSATPTASRSARVSLGVIGAVLFVCSTIVVLGNLKFGLLFALGLATVIGALWGLSAGFSWLLRWMRPQWGGFALRYGIASVHRPQNQTTTLILTLGLSAFLLSTVYLARTMVLSQVQVAGSGTRPNFVLFDVQSDQRDGVRRVLQENELVVGQEMPIVTMRLLKINGRDNLELRNDPEIPEWTLRREYRSSYRKDLIESETLISGTLPAQFVGDMSTDEVPVTVEEGIARDLKLGVGDRVRFDVQGVQLTTVISGIRRVDWRRVQTNFFFLFPPGVLEEAPQFYAVMARASSTESIGKVQRQLVTEFGNVSAIDLNLILETADQILGKVAAAVQFLALFTVLSGLLVLVGSVATTRATRLRELLLLKTVGASQNQLLLASVVEFLLLGVAATGLGILASVVGASGISVYLFEAPFALPLSPLLMIFFGVSMTVVLVGYLSTQSLMRVSPLQVLRSSG